MIKAEITLPVSIIREEKKFIAWSPALDLSTSGDDYEQVKKRFDEIAVLFLEEIIKKGTINEVLKDLGWTKIKSKWVPPIIISQEPHSVEVKA